MGGGLEENAEMGGGREKGEGGRRRESGQGKRKRQRVQNSSAVQPRVTALPPALFLWRSAESRGTAGASAAERGAGGRS